jgi:hypothetical protein
LEQNHFEVFHQERKILSAEEVLNLFYQHRNASYYPDIKEHMMTAESIVMLLVNSCETIENEDEEDLKLEPPIIRFKQLIGDK